MTVTTRSDAVTIHVKAWLTLYFNMDLTKHAVGSFYEYLTVWLNILTSIRGDLNAIEIVAGLRLEAIGTYHVV
jgi:hypothetical protein